MLNIEHYNYKPWKEEFTDGVHFEDLPIYNGWRDYIGQLEEHHEFQNIEKVLTDEIEQGNEIYPYPRLMFNALNQTNFENVKVVILGQDPYPNEEWHYKSRIPQAMGTSFSVPIGMKIPVSLNNVFKNQLSYKVIKEYPKHGNLQFWCGQGCLLLNTTLTVRKGVANSHSQYWQCLTNKIIKHISRELNDVVFVLWGGDARDKAKLIDADKHQIIISSHPSFYSFEKPLGEYPAFMKFDHFGQINQYLLRTQQDPILWTLF